KEAIIRGIIQEIVDPSAAEERLEDQVVRREGGDTTDCPQDDRALYGRLQTLPSPEQEGGGRYGQRHQKHLRTYGVFSLVVMQHGLREKPRHRPIDKNDGEQAQSRAYKKAAHHKTCEVRRRALAQLCLCINERQKAAADPPARTART